MLETSTVNQKIIFNMKNILFFILCLVSSSLLAQQTPWGFFSAETDAKFKIFEGVARIDGTALEVGDYVGVFDDDLKLAGFVQIENRVAGQALFHLEIFETSSTASNANGLRAGENYTMQFYDSSTNLYYTVSTFGPWTAAVKNGEDADGDDFTIYDTDGSPDGFLPIELLSFTGEASAIGNALFWSTATEQDHDYFILEKSKDGEQFAAFAEIKGAGNSTSMQNYRYLDETPFNGITYYRLQSVDLSGQKEVSKVIAIQTMIETTVSDLQIFPNPATEQVQIQYPATARINELRILDVTGKLVVQQSLSKTATQLEVNVANFPEGIYFVQLRGAETQLTELLSVK